MNTAPPFTWPALLTEPLHHRQSSISDRPTVGLHLKTSGEQFLGTWTFTCKLTHHIWSYAKFNFFCKDIQEKPQRAVAVHDGHVSWCFFSKKKKKNSWKKEKVRRAEVRTRAGLLFVVMSTDLRCNIRHWCKLAPCFIFSGYNLLVWKWTVFWIFFSLMWYSETIILTFFALAGIHYVCPSWMILYSLRGWFPDFLFRSIFDALLILI